MKLLEFINGLPPDARDDFARRCGTSIGYMRLIGGGHRKCGEALAIIIDRESSGIVSMEELRDDVDWQYVREKPSKPDDQEQQVHLGSPSVESDGGNLIGQAR